jgi:hypothetical protein
MSDPPRLRDLGTPGGDFTRSLLRDAAPTKGLSPADALRLQATVAKAGTLSATGGFTATVVTKALAAVTLVALGGGGVVATKHLREPVAQATVRRAVIAERPRPVTSPRAPDTTPTAAPTAPVADVVAPVIEAPSARAHVPAARARVLEAPGVAPPSPAPSATLTDEVHVVEAARGALPDDPSRALSLLVGAEHSFARPQLADERDALRVEALARLGRWDDARALAASLEARAPHSPQCARVRALLRDHAAP